MGGWAYIVLFTVFYSHISQIIFLLSCSLPGIVCKSSQVFTEVLDLPILMQIYITWSGLLQAGLPTSFQHHIPASIVEKRGTSVNKYILICKQNFPVLEQLEKMHTKYQSTQKM